MRMWFCAVALAGLAGCSNPGPGDAGVEAGAPTFGEVQQILTTSCAVGTSSCHASGVARLDLSVGHAYAALVGPPSSQVARLRIVAPGDPANSFLMHKLDGTMNTVPECMARPADCGESMPQRNDLLPAAQRERIRAWIAAGAAGP